MAVLKLTTQPPGATVSIDDEARPERTPATLSLPAGPARIKIALEGYVTIEEQMALEVGKERAVSYTLVQAAAAKKPGTLEIRTNTDNATFYLDDKIVHQGSTLALDKVEPKAYTLKITAPGRRALVQQITVRPGHTLSLTLKLHRKRGRPPPVKGTKTPAHTPEDPDDTLDPFKRRR
jgi:hypothetical protein